MAKFDESSLLPICMNPFNAIYVSHANAFLDVPNPPSCPSCEVLLI